MPEVRIVRHPKPFDLSIYFPERTSIPKFDPNSTAPFQVDLRFQDLTKLDLSKSKNDLLFAAFDSQTQGSIFDQTLLVDHIEYKDRIQLYEEASDDSGGWQQVQIHGPAVASIAVGKTAGVAPDVFWNTALKTGRTIQIQHDEKDYQFGVILDPQALIHALQNQ